MEELQFIIDNLDMYMLVFARIAGIFFMNPVISQKAIPAMVKAAVVLCISVLITPAISIPADFEAGTFDFLLNFGKEIIVGVLLGYVFNVFFYMLMTAGDFLDTNFGLAMAKVFDPSTNIQSAFSANLLRVFFILYFFATDSHVTLMSVAISSFDILPIGSEIFALDSAAGFAIDLFGSVFVLALKLVIPFIAAEFTLEVSMGILMKLIPQIHVFVIQYQLKILLAIVLLFILAGPIAAFLDNYTLMIFDEMKNALAALGG
ncbi:MAG: flagellar biosynthetic protein FliR [Porcipelethomonas sp.]